MLYCREEALNKVNAMYDTNITVRKSSSWEDNQIEIDKEQNNVGGDKDGDINTK